ncbi:MAG: hypothetical protein LBI59_02300 [Candidatus Accumulibacter sp.]|jgi:hypothetical protein|nr:hypothetical protein [Accumulibacter sp.]
MTPKQRIMCLALGRAAPGMELAEPVFDRKGTVLLTAGTVLDVDMFEQMIRRGVASVSVRVPDHRDEETIARELDDIRARIDTIFRGPGNVAREHLRDTILDYRLESAK